MEHLLWMSVKRPFTASGHSRRPAGPAVAGSPPKNGRAGEANVDGGDSRARRILDEGGSTALQGRSVSFRRTAELRRSRTIDFAGQQ
jgi:hypothetical protein